MKKIFTKQEIRDLLNQVYREEISFSRRVEIMNEMVSEAEVSEYKDGDFVVDESGDILIFRKKEENFIYDHAYLQNRGILWIQPYEKTNFTIERHATEDEKQKLLDALAKEGKRWNAEKKCVEDILKRKFKAGDKVKIKDGISSKTHRFISPNFASTMDEFIGKELTVKEYTNRGFVVFNEDKLGYLFAEDWLEPWSDEPKKGDLAIFWDNGKSYAIIRFYDRKDNRYHYDSSGTHGSPWNNAVKWDGTKEQFEKILRGEI